MESKTIKLKLYFAIAAISFVQGLQISISPVLGAISARYSDVDISLVQMLITIPAFLSMFSSLLCGMLVLKLSKKKLLLIACGVAGMAGLLPLAADSFALLFAARALYGVALGWCASLNAAVVSEFFEGDERVTAMGIQAASVGAGMMLLSSLSGMLGRFGFRMSFFTNLVAFVCFAVILVCLPDTGVEVETETEKVGINSKVLGICAFTFVQMMFLITFSTNISMHIAGSLAGDTAVSGMLTGIFSGTQLVIGFVLGQITRITKKYVMPVAMGCFAVGALLLVLFPDNLIMLAVAAVFCGLSQGIYVPSGFVAVAEAVPPVAVTMASACFNASSCIGQTISPFVTNTLSRLLFGQSTTRGVYTIATVGMAIAAAIHAFVKSQQSGN